MPCMCGATDCPSCGPAQGYAVIKVRRNGRWVWENPEEDEEEPEVKDPCEICTRSDPCATCEHFSDEEF